MVSDDSELEMVISKSVVKRFPLSVNGLPKESKRITRPEVVVKPASKVRTTVLDSGIKSGVKPGPGIMTGPNT